MYSYMIVESWNKQCFVEEYSIMYNFAVICFVLAASLVERNNAAITEAQKSKIYGKLLTSGIECMKDFPLSLEHIKTLREKKVPDEEVAKCFTHCLFKRLGLMETGKLSEKTARSAARRIFKDGDDMLTKLDDLMGKCSHVNEEHVKDGDKGCDRAKLAFECFITRDRIIGCIFT